MKNLDLNAYGVQEMNHQEMVETDGGDVITALIITGIALVSSSCVTLREANDIALRSIPPSNTLNATMKTVNKSL